jgi:hypothetical protein
MDQIENFHTPACETPETADSCSLPAAQYSSAAKRRRTGAVLSTEMIFVLPLVFGLLLAVVEVSFLWVGSHRTAAAARAGCWVARLAGSDEAEIQQEVCRVLGKQLMIDAHKTRILRGPYSGDPVLVEVCVPMRAAAPDMLGMLGFGLGERKFVAHCLMRRE